MVLRTTYKILFSTLAVTLFVSPSFSNGLPLGFTQAEFDAVYSDYFLSLGDGYQLPLSKTSLADVYRRKDAPQDLKEEWGDFQFIGDSKGYIHLGEIPDETRLDELYGALSDLESYNNIPSSQGLPLFESLVPLDSQGRVLKSFPAPQPDKNGKTSLYARATVRVQGFNLSVDIQLDIHETSDGLIAELYNSRPVRYGIFGQILAPQGLFIHIEFHGLDNGWLVRGISRFHMAPFLSAFIRDPASLGAYGLVMMDWLESKTVYPILE